MIVIGESAASDAKDSAMWIEFVKAVIWPATIVGIAFLFRIQFRDLLDRLSSLKWGDKEAKFGEELDKVEALVPAPDPPPPPPPMSMPMSFGVENTRQQPEEVVADSFHAYWQNVGAQQPPAYTVIVAWREIERALVALAKNRDINVVNRTPINMVALANKLGLPMDEVSSISEMRSLRNRVVHRDESVSMTDAMRYAELADNLARSIRSRSHVPPPPIVE